MSNWRTGLYPERNSARIDEWALITEQKTMEEQKAKQYQKLLAQQKRRRLKEHLDAQIYQKQQKQRLLKLQDQRYSEQAIRKAKQIEQAERQRRKSLNQRKKLIQNENKYLFSGIVQSNINENNLSARNSMDIGYRAQHQRRKQVDQQKKKMIDELDRQIQEKQRAKAEQKQYEIIKEKQDLNYSIGRLQKRKQQNTWRYRENNLIQQKYLQMIQKQSQKAKRFQLNHVDLEAKKKHQEEILKANYKDYEKREANMRMKQILDQQIKIHEQKKREQESINPQDFSYGLFGKMLNNRNLSALNKKQQYYQQLKEQIQQKKGRKQLQKFMNQEEYKINLNHLNRAVQGKFANQKYIDRSIHALSQPHNVNVNLFDGKIQRPQVLAIKPKLQQIKNRNKDRNIQNTFDLNKSF